MILLSGLSCRTLLSNALVKSLSFRPLKPSSTFNRTPSRWIKSEAVRDATTTTTTGPPVETKRLLGKWLLGCSGMVFGAVVLGGVTRLTDSGLSMVDWHLFKERPPWTSSEWIAEFAKYQQFPEFKYKHQDMTLAGFKFIWYMEYVHRMWGRATGAIFALPAAYFWYRGYFSQKMKMRVCACGLLLIFEGLLGWHMVQSGLEEKQDSPYVPRVSQYRLASHLATAFFLYTVFLWSTLSHLSPPQQMTVTSQLRKLRKYSHRIKGLTYLTAITGAFVAGLGAGLTHNTFPKMDDKWIPDDILAMEPVRKNFTENTTTVQFVHRIMGTVTLVAILGIWWYSRKLALPPKARFLMNSVASVSLAQVGLGIAALLLYDPIPLAALHQAGALTLMSFALWLSHELKLARRIPK